MRLRHQTSWALGTAWLASLGILHLAISAQLESSFRADLAEDMVKETTEVVHELDNFMAERRVDLAFLAGCPEVLSQQRVPATEELTRLRDLNGCYEWLRLLSPDGVVIADTNQMSIGARQATPPPATPVSVEFLPSSGNAGMNAHFRQKSNTGWIEGMVPLQRLRGRLTNHINWPAGTLIELVEKDRSLFRSVPVEEIHRLTSLERPLAQVAPGVGHWQPDGSLVVAVDSTIGWRLRAQIPALVWQSKLIPVQQIIWLVAVVGGILGIWLIWWLAGRLARPLMVLADQAGKVAAEPTLALAEGQPGDPSEILQLRVALQQMLQEIAMQVDQVRLSSERVRLAAEAAHLGIWEFHPASGALRWDDGMLPLFGATRNRLTGTLADWSERVLPEDLPTAQTALMAAIEARRPLRLRFRIRHEDGQVRWIEGVANPQCDAGGMVVSIIGVNLDVTEQIEREQHLRTALDSATAANRAKDEFLAVMSHELRTPLNGVIGMIDLLTASGLNPDQDEMAQIVHESGMTLLTILNDILDFSRIEAGDLKLAMVPYMPGEVLHEVVSLMRPQVEIKGLTVAVHIRSEAPLQVLGDRARFSQVLFNLIGNALKFTDWGGIVITVDQYDGHARFRIADTGIGIAADHLDKLFKRFSQIDSSMSRRFGGTGLGLAISDGLVRGMGGRICVESILGQGSVFSVLLPLPAVWDPPAGEGSNDQLCAAPIPTATRPLRILLSEDNQVNQRVAQVMLESLGHTVQITDDGATAVAAWRTGTFDVILMDMQMPGMDGLEATRAIRAAEALLLNPEKSQEKDQGKRIPIIAVTANARDLDRQACMAAGMDEVVPKPITRASLSQALARMTGS